MSLRLNRGVLALRAATYGRPLQRQPVRGVATHTQSQAQSRSRTAVRRSFLLRSAQLAGAGTFVAAVSLLALTADTSLFEPVDADDGSASPDGLSAAPLAAPVGSAAATGRHDGAAQLSPASQQSPSEADSTALAARANQPASALSPSGKPHLVILGSGWGAVSLLKGLDRDLYEVTVISPRNYFLFTPLLPSATTGQVESRTLMEPIRRICHRIHAHYFEGKVAAQHSAHTRPRTASTGPQREHDTDRDCLHCVLC